MNVQRKYSQPPHLTSTPRPCRKTTATLRETFDEVSPIFPVPGRKAKSLIPVAKKSSLLTKPYEVRNIAQINNIDIQKIIDPPQLCILKSPEEINNPVVWVIPPEVKTATLKRRSGNVQTLTNSNEVLEPVEEPSDVSEANPSQTLKPAAKKSARPRSTLKTIAEEDFKNMSDEDKINLHRPNNNTISIEFYQSDEDRENRPAEEQVLKESLRKTRKNLATTTAAAAEKTRALRPKRNVKNYKDDVTIVIGDVNKTESENIMDDTNTRRASKIKCAVRSGTTRAKQSENGPETLTEAVSKSSIQSVINKNRKTQAKSSKTHCDDMENSELTNTEDKDVNSKAEQVPKESLRTNRKNLATATAAADEKTRALKRNVKNYKDDDNTVIGDVIKTEPENIMDDRDTRRAPKIKCAVGSVSSGTTRAKELENDSKTLTEAVSKSSIQSAIKKNRKTQAKSSKPNCEDKEKSEPTNTKDKDVNSKAKPIKKTVEKKRVLKTKTDKSKSEEKLMETNGNEVACGVQKTTEKTLPNDSAPSRSKTTVKRKAQVATEDLDQSGKKQKRTKKTHPSKEVPANNPVETKPGEVDNTKGKKENEKSYKCTVLREKGAISLADESRPSIPLPFTLHESERPFHVKSCFGLERARVAEYVPGVVMYSLLHINNHVMTGKMLINPRATINTSSTNTTYFVTQGVASVTLMSTKMVIPSHDEKNTFFIPKGADFSIVNEGRDLLKLLFTKFKD